jgi:hypothetical protein
MWFDAGPSIFDRGDGAVTDGCKNGVDVQLRQL